MPWPQPGHEQQKTARATQHESSALTRRRSLGKNLRTELQTNELSRAAAAAASQSSGDDVPSALWPCSHSHTLDRKLDNITPRWARFAPRWVTTSQAHSLGTQPVTQPNSASCPQRDGKRVPGKVRRCCRSDINASMAHCFSGLNMWVGDR